MTTKIVLPNGIEIMGEEADRVTDVIEMARDEKEMPYRYGHYYSQSKQDYIPIKDMATKHIRNAVAKYYVQWVMSLKNVTTPEFIRLIANGIDDLTWNELMIELSYRVRDGEK